MTRSHDGSTCWMVAFDSEFRAFYVVLHAAGNDPIAFPGVVSDVSKGPSQDRSFINLELNPVSVRLLETSAGGALRVTRAGQLVPFAEIKTGMLSDERGNLAASFRFQDSAILPGSLAELSRWDAAKLTELKQAGKITIGAEAKLEDRKAPALKQETMP